MRGREFLGKGERVPWGEGGGGLAGPELHFREGRNALSSRKVYLPQYLQRPPFIEAERGSLQGGKVPPEKKYREKRRASLRGKGKRVFLPGCWAGALPRGERKRMDNSLCEKRRRGLLSVFNSGEKKTIEERGYLSSFMRPRKGSIFRFEIC